MGAVDQANQTRVSNKIAQSHHARESGGAQVESCAHLQMLKNEDTGKNMSIARFWSIKYDQLNLEKCQLLKEMKITVA